MGSDWHLYDLEAWNRHREELMREVEEARLAERLRAMRRNSTGKDIGAAMGFLVAALMVAALMVLVGVSSPAHAETTFTVNTTADLSDANLDDTVNVCDADISMQGKQCTLRAAIQEANHTQGAEP